MQDNTKLVHCTGEGCTNTFRVSKNSTRCLCPLCRSKINSANRTQAKKGGTSAPTAQGIK